jgi:hypothetical protein
MYHRTAEYGECNFENLIELIENQILILTQIAATVSEIANGHFPLSMENVCYFYFQIPL